jgi:hypothetical protein
VTLVPFSKTNNLTEDGYHASTDADGSFRISGVKPGEYIPVARKPGFVLPLFFGHLIHIDQEPPQLRLELIPPGRLRGRVIGTDGKPAAKVQVAIANQYAYTAATDAEGAFVFDNLDPGS